MPPSSGKKKQQLKVAGLSHLLQASPSDTTAAATVARSVTAAVQELVPSQQGRISSKSGVAAGVPYVGVLLQAAGWLARAWHQQELPRELQTAVYLALTEALTLSATLLQQRDKLTLEYLRPALRPCPEDGVTPEAVFALSLAAASLLENPPGMDSSRVGIARFVASSWCSFNEACFLFNPNKSAPAALLLTTPLLQLMAALPQHIKNVKQGPDSFMKLMGSAVATFDVALDSPSHPGLRHWLPNSSSSLSPQQLEVCDINIRAALQQQDLCWRSLAVQVTFLADVTASAGVPPRPLEPERFCPDYGASSAWPPEVWSRDKELAMAVANRALGALVLAELWWLWPWQLEVLEVAKAVAAAVASAAGEGQQADPINAAPVETAAATGGSRRPDGLRKADDDIGSSSTAPKRIHHDCTRADSSTSGSNNTDSGNGNSSSSGGGGGSCTQGSMQAPRKEVWRCEEHKFSSIIPYPLTPALVAPGCVAHPQCPLPPVTRQQLQLVLSLLVGTGGESFSTAALLLVLLLQRADPGLRAAFLNGPEASLLLVTLVTWGCHPGEWGVHEVPSQLGTTDGDTSWEGAVRNGLDLMQNKDMSVACFSHPASAALLLVYCYLEPAAPRHLDGQQQPQLVATPVGPSAIHTGAEEVVTVPVPGCDLQLARGVIPTPQLVGTLEALARVIDPLNLVWLEVVVDACCRALMQPCVAAGGSHGGSSGSSADGGSADGRGIGDSSSSSSSSSDLRSGVLQAFASMAVMLAATVDSMPNLKCRGSPMLLHTRRLASSAAIAAHLLRLAAHEVAAGRAGRATLALATAAQQLSCACANEAPVVLERLEDSAELTARQVFDGQSSSAELVVHTSHIAFILQGLLDALAALRAAVEGWQQRGTSGVHGPLPGSVCGVPPEAACAAQQQQEEEEQRLENQQFDRYLQAKQEVEQEQQQLKHRQRQEQQDLQQATLRVQKELEQQKQLLEQQQESGQSASAQQSQQQYVELLEGQLVELEQKQVQQQKTHADQHLEQQRSALLSYNSAVEDLIEDVSCVSNISLRLAGCNWVGCTQQHKGMYSADAAVAGLRGVRCGGCGLVRYCCPEHQQADWKRHGRVCGRLAQARAAAGYAGGGSAAGTS